MIIIEELTTFHGILAIATAVLAVIAVLIGKKAMEKGLTYSTFMGAMLVLVFVALINIWHVIADLFHVKEVYGEAIAEYPIYFLYIGVYVIFIWLGYKTMKSLKGK